MISIIFVTLTILVIVLVYIYLKQCYAPRRDDLPGVQPHIFFGNLLNSGILKQESTFNQVLIDYQRRFGDKFQYWFGSHRCLVFCRVEHAQAIFSDRHTFEQSPLFLPNFDLFCPNGIAMLTGAKWKRHIRVLLPMLKRAKIVGHLAMITQCTDRFIDRYLHAGQIHRNLYAACQSLTMNVIGLIGFDCDFDTHVDSPIKKAFLDFIFHSTLLMMTPWTPRWLGKIYLRFNRKYQRAYQLVHKLAEKLVKQEQNKQSEIEDERPKTLIASLVSSLNEEANDENISSGLNHVEIFDEVVMMILAGYDTTSTTLAWFIFFASKNPRVQQRMKDELREHNLMMTDDPNYLPSLTPNNLASLTYCEYVTKEVLRLAPTASFTTRIATRDTILDDVKINRGQTIFIALHNINTDARYWHHADPKEFVPERYLAEDQNHHPLAMITFGGGHRACIGQELAWFELKAAIVRLMQRGITFEDTPENTGGYEELITCFPKSLAVRVRFEKS
ncbi:unnamed protein product [Rotaria socialis]|uniref:Cytochrome P450 n=1 Tax=Rotaria socialis TaxID=392032 RepID=A0A818PW68_9BILA|nr:unnamed protein product [Rotaria socialis]CAF3708491.1 unnamed protein product [Rotaria socialis]CAF4269654.1 unnamed protein product [Rotaria socialis]CAF4459879.1 unnamed protein product [Rotaria socialis]